MRHRIRQGPKCALPHVNPQNSTVFLLNHEKSVALAFPLLHLLQPNLFDSQFIAVWIANMSTLPAQEVTGGPFGLPSLWCQTWPLTSLHCQLPLGVPSAG